MGKLTGACEAVFNDGEMFRPANIKQFDAASSTRLVISPPTTHQTARDGPGPDHQVVHTERDAGNRDDRRMRLRLR